MNYKPEYAAQNECKNRACPFTLSSTQPSFHSMSLTVSFRTIGDKKMADYMQLLSGCGGESPDVKY